MHFKTENASKSNEILIPAGQLIFQFSGIRIDSGTTSEIWKSKWRMESILFKLLQLETILPNGVCITEVVSISVLVIEQIKKEFSHGNH